MIFNQLEKKSEIFRGDISSDAVIKEFDRPESLTKEIFGNCCVNETLTLLHGILYLCPYAAHIENLNVIKENEKDRVNLFNDNKDIKQKIRDLYFGKEYLNACKFCNGRDHNVDTIEAAIQTDKPLPYSKFN